MFNIDQIQNDKPIILEQVPLSKKLLPRHKEGELFLKGPIPWIWLSKAASLSGRAIQVALTLWLLAGIQKSKTIKLSHARLRELGVDRFAAARGLDALELAKLVSVVRANGRSPVVTLLNL